MERLGLRCRNGCCGIIEAQRNGGLLCVIMFNSQVNPETLRRGTCKENVIAEVVESRESMRCTKMSLKREGKG